MTMLSLLQTDDVYFEVPIILKRIKKPSENCKSLWPFSRCHILFSFKSNFCFLQVLCNYYYIFSPLSLRNLYICLFIFLFI